MAKLVKLTGNVRWVQSGDAVDGKITRAILHSGKRITIDCKCGPDQYTVNLTSETGHYFTGSFTCNDGSKGGVSGTLYKSQDSYFIFGVWTEQETKNYWWTDLTKVEKFPDEGPT